MIERIYIDNYRCFSSFEFQPARINLILGPNGSGKSSLFDVLSRIVDLVVEGVDVVRAFPTDTLTRWDTRPRQRFELEVRDGEGLFKYELLVEHDRERQVASIVKEEVSRDGLMLFRFEEGRVFLHNNEGAERTAFHFRGSRSFLAEIEEREETRDLRRLLMFFSELRVLKLDPSRMETATTMEASSLASDGSNFASWYRHLQQENPEGLAGFFSKLCEALPGFSSLKLISASGRTRNRELVAAFTQGKSTYEIDFNEMSDGQRILVVLYALLLDLDGRRRTLLLDEPGNHLALSEIQPWLLELGDALGDKGQLIVASHSPQVIDHLAAEHPYSFERKDGGPVRVRKAVFERDAGAKASEQVVSGMFDEQ